jgi:hypothetical protein
MIEKLDDVYVGIISKKDIILKINKIIDLLNAIVVDVDGTKCIDGSKKAEPDFITTSYMTDGNTQEYYGQNGARVQFDHPIPAGYTITITDPTAAENVQSEKIAQGFKNLQDPYEKQSKWIGTLCRCWDSDINDDIWGILQDIKDNKTEKYYLYGIGYEHCEPVKPDDDIIYKGGDNE